MKKDEYFVIAKKIWNADVPQDGQSFTIQGEMIRGIEKLRDEAQRNGNVNRDCGHAIMLAYVGEILLNAEIFDREVCVKISETLNQISDSKKIILEDAPYDYLTERVVDWFLETKGRSRVFNPTFTR